jgi:hypothetical protein
MADGDFHVNSVGILKAWFSTIDADGIDRKVDLQGFEQGDHLVVTGATNEVIAITTGAYTDDVVDQLPIQSMFSGSHTLFTIGEPVTVSRVVPADHLVLTLLGGVEPAQWIPILDIAGPPITALRADVATLRAEFDDLRRRIGDLA